jgi:hypothetical protein
MSIIDEALSANATIAKDYDSSLVSRERGSFTWAGVRE